MPYSVYYRGEINITPAAHERTQKHRACLLETRAQ